MSAKQWVAHAGLDPRKVQSGTSLDKPTRISKRGQRAALFMPALTAAHRDPNAHAPYESLVDRGKRPMQANVAVMRKLIHAVHAMFRHDQPYEGARALRPVATATSASVHAPS